MEEEGARGLPVSLGIHLPALLGYGLVQVSVRIDSSGGRRRRVAPVRRRVLTADEFHFHVVLVVRLRQGVLPQLKKEQTLISFLSLTLPLPLSICLYLALFRRS